jgi:hypothetical protein
MIWKKEGRGYTCTDTPTPGTVELTFHGDNDVQRLRVRRFGFSSMNLDVKSTDRQVGGVLNLEKSVSSSFQLEDDAQPDVKQLNEALKKEFEKTLLTDPDAFRCAPFDLDSIHLTKDKETGAVELDVALRLDRSFGGPALRLASHALNAQERDQKTGQVALENGFAEVFGRFHRMAAKFADVKDIMVVGSYSTTEAYLDTEDRSYSEIQYTYGNRYEPVQGRTVTVVTPHPVTVHYKNTVVKDQEAERAITFVMPAAQIPDTLDKKAISDAVLASGKILIGSVKE